MLKLINIIKGTNTIEADYIPEQSELKAHVKLNLLNDSEEIEKIEDFSAIYGRMAINGLSRTLEEYEKSIILEIPKERIVMWY